MEKSVRVEDVTGKVDSRGEGRFVGIAASLIPCLPPIEQAVESLELNIR